MRLRIIIPHILLIGELYLWKTAAIEYALTYHFPEYAKDSRKRIRISVLVESEVEVHDFVFELIKEYNEKAKKTPLEGVELNVRSANSTVSDKSGNFTLQFLTLKPGEKVNVRRIEKLGYEVFNKEAIEQWNLNPKTPFVIVMCRSDKFKKIRDNYEKVSSESYAHQLKKEEAALLKLKEQGKLKEA